MKYFFQILNDKNYYMNYGLWDNEKIQDLRAANERLVEFIFEKMNRYKKKGIKILDVGCGYGEQDLTWSNNFAKKTKARITAIDISKSQIKFAQHLRALKKIKPKKVKYEIGNALDIAEKYKTKSFDLVVSLESAFHYKDRPRFFKNVHHVLKNKEGGVFIISDIMLKKNYKKTFLNDLCVKIFSDFFHVPKQNLIKADEWQEDIRKAGFEIVECNDITEKTFIPFYDYFVPNYLKKRHMPAVLASLIQKIFHNYQPFAYLVVTCKVI